MAAWLAAAGLAGCALLPPGEEAPRVPVSDNSAVIALVDTARADVAAERPGPAAAALERALRIEPRNPRLWHELAQLRFKEGEYAQVEGMAARSNTWAGADKSLRAANWRLIGEARSRAGDATGARAAFDKAATLER
jgi:predicted Zn-dependent protease